MDTHEDSLYGGPSVTNACRRCKGEFGERSNCAQCGRHTDRKLLSRNRARTRNIGGKRGRNSGTTKTSKNKS